MLNQKRKTKKKHIKKMNPRDFVKFNLIKERKKKTENVRENIKIIKKT